nr:MAG TPA: hypothetical protein [Caudoviricetes sp.]
MFRLLRLHIYRLHGHLHRCNLNQGDITHTNQMNANYLQQQTFVLSRARVNKIGINIFACTNTQTLTNQYV